MPLFRVSATDCFTLHTNKEQWFLPGLSGAMPRHKGRKQTQHNPKQDVDAEVGDAARDGHVTRTLCRGEEDRRAEDHPDDRPHPQIRRRMMTDRTKRIRRNQNKTLTGTTKR